MMADAQQRRFDIIMVWKLDRWARSLKFLVVSLAELAALGVSFVSLRDNLDLTTPAGRLMVQLLGAMETSHRCQSKRIGSIACNVQWSQPPRH
jgi:DNA invertase Pin-like site-specific DNA recombinase